MKNIYKIIFLSLLTSVFCPLFSISQTAPGIEWAKCFGGSFDDNGTSVQQTSDGGFIIGGSTRSNNGNVSGNHGNYDYWAAKLDSAGNIEWQKCLGGSNWDAGGTIRQIANGGYIFSGYTQSNNGDVSGNHGSTDTWVVHLDSTGNIVWQKCLGGTWQELGNRIVQTSDGGFASISWSKSNDGDVTSNYGSDDYWLVKQNSAGNIVWEKNYGGSFQDMGSDIVQTTDGGFLLSGSTSSYDIDITGFHGFVDNWIVKTDSIGNLQWQKCLGGTGQDESLSAIQTIDGGYIVTSRTYSDDGDVTGNHGSADGWVVKLNSNGNILWQKCFGGTQHDGLFHADESPDGSIVLLGYTYSNDGDVSGNHDTTANYSDIWVLKVDGAGNNIIWQKCLGGSNSEAAYTIDVTADGGCIISGFTESNDRDISGNHGNQDYWIVKLYTDTITGIADSPLERGKGCVIFPNPASEFTVISYPFSVGDEIRLTDISGRILFSKIFSSSTSDFRLLTSAFSPGVYLLNITNEKTGERRRGKIVISD